MLQIRCRRLQPLAGVSASRRPQRKRVNLAAAVEDEPEPIDIPEIKEVIDASLKGVDKAIYGALKDHGPKMLPFTVRCPKSHCRNESDIPFSDC